MRILAFSRQLRRVWLISASLAALILIYSTVDSLAFLSTKAGKADVERSDFVGWVDKYMKPQRLGVTSLDLYAARCGVVHALKAESSLYRRRKARLVFYAWGDRQPIQPDLNSDWVMLHLNDLASALIEGTKAFLGEIQKDSQRSKVVSEKLKKVFWNLQLPG
jgi:hypothetical protein